MSFMHQGRQTKGSVILRNNKKVVKQIKIDIDKCIGCRSCELVCSASHASPKYSSVNPARSRIRVMVDELKDTYVPVRAGDYTFVECIGRYNYIIDGKGYRECSFCRAACPTRDYFKDPDTGIPVTCDMCESEPDIEQPWCVTVCGCGALTYETREEEPDKATDRDEVMVGMEALVDKFGLRQVMDALVRRSIN